VAPQTITDLVKCLKWWQPTVCMSTVLKLSGMLENQFHRTNSEPHKCVYCYQHEHRMLHLDQTHRHSLDVWCGVWQWQGSAEGLSWVFSKQNVSRQSYVCFCRPSPRGNWYICSEQAKHGEDDQFTCHNLMMVCSILRTIPLKALALLVTQSVWIVVLCGMVYVSNSSVFTTSRSCRL
jgi:hypothetical protein